MSNYTQVQDALSQGVDPSLICSTCPWDRFCITPPEMTKADIDAKMAEAQSQAKERAQSEEGKDNGAMGALVGTLMTTLIFAGKDTQATVCPVFSTRMRGSEGRKIVDSIRSQMKSWDDNVVTS